MDGIDHKLLLEITQNIPLTPEPFNDIAAKLKISPDEVIRRILILQEQGVIRRFGAVIKPNDIDLTANALVAWKIPKERISEVGAYFARVPEISHCYERQIVKGSWEYNLYTVMHAKERQEIEDAVSCLSGKINVCDYVVLYSLRNLKLLSANQNGAIVKTCQKKLSGV